MNKLIPFLAVVLSVPGVASGNGEAPAYERVDYVLKIRDVTPIDDLTLECGWATMLGGPVASGLRANLYSVGTRRVSGEIRRDDREKVGELLVCASGIYPTYRTDGQADLEISAAWLIAVNGHNLAAFGSGRFRGPQNLLADDNSMLVFGASVVELTEGGKRIRGSLSTNYLEQEGSLMTMRLFHPVAP